MAARSRRLRPIGLYLHLPFCASRCSYCTFVSSTELELMPRTVAALLVELERLARPAGRALATLYLGGGTPSVLPGALLETLVAGLRRCFSWDHRTEVTLEANPDDIESPKLELWRRLGFNRVSIGVQSFTDGVLAYLSRRHSAAGARRAVEAVRDAGFEHSLDLMLALPGLDPSSLATTLAETLRLRPHHVSVYLLETDKPHQLGRLAERHPGLLPDADEAAAQYLTAGRTLVAAGYRHYEVSSFALPGHAARHNLRYWLGQPVLGAGVAAHSQAGRRRWANTDDLDSYLDAVEHGRSPRAWGQARPPDEAVKERVMLGLRLARGVREETVLRAGRVAPEFAERLAEFAALGLTRRGGGRIRLTPRGWLVSNELLAALW